jgi:hypothetical protein
MGVSKEADKTGYGCQNAWVMEFARMTAAVAYFRISSVTNVGEDKLTGLTYYGCVKAT